MKKCTLRQIAARIGMSGEQMAHQCHVVSLKIVRSGLFGESCRVARGWCRGVGSQHSWVVVGDDCYAEDAVIVDATLWSYDPAVAEGKHGGVWYGTYEIGRHRPHGFGVLDYCPSPPAPRADEIIKLPGLSKEARLFLRSWAPDGMNAYRWMILANAPVGGWPAKEILSAMYQTKRLQALLPIDKVGMVTDLNPGGLYR